LVGVEGLTVWVRPAGEDDLEEVAELTGRLRAELLEVDVDSVDPVTGGSIPESAKGLGGVAGALAVRFGTVEGLRAVFGVLFGWCTRTGRSVEVSLGGDVLKLTGVSARQQEQIIDAWLARHAPGS
jgi:hypothetical protein